MTRPPNRRQFLKCAVGGGAWLALQGLGGIGCKRQSAPERASRGPRYFVQILLSGGHDTVYTTDPKERAEVDEDIALPTDNQFTETAGLRLGPHFRPLERWGPELSFLNGVQVGTANHETGFRQFLRLKTNITQRMPSALDIIGANRDGQPLGVVYLNLGFGDLHSPGYLGTADAFYFGEKNLLDQAESADPEQLLSLAKVLRRQAHSLRARGASGREAITAEHIDQAAALFERMPHVEPFQPEHRSEDYTSQTMALSLQRAMWLIEHDLARGIFIDAGLLGWDTHINNESRQGSMNGSFIRHFVRFLEELEWTSNDRGRLVDQTAIVVGSDLGRFPKMNDMLGKDHLPQTSFFFRGPSFAKGQSFGRTGGHMEALPISLSTGGSPASGGRIPILDDIGTTLLASAGLDPQRYGYNGKLLEFLLA